MSLRRLHVFLTLLTLTVSLGVRADNDTPASSSYSVKIAGFAKGTGQATVSGTTVSITATVTDENGNSGTFIASGLTIDAKSHFHGSGTVFGKTMTVSGRLDSPQAGDKQLKTRRVVGSFKTTDSQYGRIAGFVPVTGSDSSGGGSGNSGDGNGGTGNGGTGNGGNGNSNGGGPGPGGDHGGGENHRGDVPRPINAH